MTRGRPRNLSNYEKLKAKKIREFLSRSNISRFDSMNDAALLHEIRISDDRAFISLDQHDRIITKISDMVSEFRDN
jgi:hypothetical protein